MKALDLGWKVSMAGAATSIIFVATNMCLSQQHVSCCNKSMLVVTFVTVKYFCCNKSFVTTNICCDKHVFVTTKDVLSPQTRVCGDKSKLVARNMCLSQQIFVARKVLSRQKYVCATSIHLSQQKMCFELRQTQTRVCHDKTFVATKIVLVAATANDRKGA